MADELVESLKRVPLFAGVRDKELGRLAKVDARAAASPRARRSPPRASSGVGFFLIEDGNATVSLEGEIVRTLGPGDHFGEIALIDEGPRSATVTASTDLRCRGMAAWEFQLLRPGAPRGRLAAAPDAGVPTSRRRGAQHLRGGDFVAAAEMLVRGFSPETGWCR